MATPCCVRHNTCLSLPHHPTADSRLVSLRQPFHDKCKMFLRTVVCVAHYTRTVSKESDPSPPLPHHRRFIPPISRPISGLASHPCEVHAEHRGLRGVHLPSRPPILLSLQREAGWRRSSCLDLTSFALMPSKNSKTCQTSRTEWRMLWSYSVLLGFSHSQLMIGSADCALDQFYTENRSSLSPSIFQKCLLQQVEPPSPDRSSFAQTDQQQFHSLSLLAPWHQPRCLLAPFSSRAVSCSWCSHFTRRIFTETTSHT